MEAMLEVLYSQEAKEPGDRFVELRQWRTPDTWDWRQWFADFVLETGFVNEQGDLVTTCQVLPGHLSQEQALALVGVDLVTV